MRRGNKSHKVPNVKLRPAQAPRDRNAPWGGVPDHFSSDSEVAPNASMVDLCPRPFRGVTVCATGIMDKPTLFKQAFELGATSTNDFTDRVTHLIANSHGGAKYMCALERKIPIVTPEWIAEAHAIWLRGDDVDFEECVSNHRLPIFSGVILSLSGLEDIARRTEINRIVTAQQGTYVKNLERPVKVTHLLCSGDTETDKMRYAEKFNKRGEANIHLVWEEWFWDCVEFGGRFDERKYQVSRPRPERKSLHDAPVSCIHVRGSVPGSDRNSAAPQPEPSKALPAPANFPIVTSISFDPEEEEEAATIKRIPEVTLHLWKSLLKPRGFELEDGKLVRSPPKSQASRSQPFTPTRPRAPLVNDKGEERESIISSFRRANSFAPPTKVTTTRQPFRRTATVATFGPEDAEGSGLQHSMLQAETSMVTLFAGYTFRLLGEARCTTVRSAIESSGGVVIDDDMVEVSFTIVRLVSGSKLYHEEPDDLERSKYRTECWLEHSVFLERICEPSENVSFGPLNIPTPILDAEQIILSVSGLDQSELCWIRRLLRALGITLSPTFSRRSTHLLCPSGTGAKYDKALEWRISVVSMEWLEHMAREGSIPDVRQYLVGGSVASPLAGVDDDDAMIREVPMNKGKGKAKEVDVQMADITNSDPSGPLLFAKKPNLLQDRAPALLDDAYHEETGEHGILFGKPRNFLGQDEPRMSSSPAPLPPQSSSPPLEYLSLEKKDPPALQAQPTVVLDHDEISKDDAGHDAIPSSKSPSPMKLISSSIPETMPSPVRPPDPDAVAKALQKSLTSLLGKRQTSEDDILPQPRKGKRARPQSRKILSRQESHDLVISPPRPIPHPELDSSAYVDMSLLDGTRSTDESLRVTYDDPAQREEKRRLMMLLGGEPPDAPVQQNVGRKGRRIVRVAGF